MNKVICDICGTSYPDTATNCPICGFERDQKLSVLDEDIFLEEETVEEAPAEEVAEEGSTDETVQ